MLWLWRWGKLSLSFCVYVCVSLSPGSRGAASIPPCQHLGPGTGCPHGGRKGFSSRAHSSLCGYSGPALGLSSYTRDVNRAKQLFQSQQSLCTWRDESGIPPRRPASWKPPGGRSLCFRHNHCTALLWSHFIFPLLQSNRTFVATILLPMPPCCPEKQTMNRAVPCIDEVMANTSPVEFFSSGLLKGTETLGRSSFRSDNPPPTSSILIPPPLFLSDNLVVCC